MKRAKLQATNPGGAGSKGSDQKDTGMDSDDSDDDIDTSFTTEKTPEKEKPPITHQDEAKDGAKSTVDAAKASEVDDRPSLAIRAAGASSPRTMEVRHERT